MKIIPADAASSTPEDLTRPSGTSSATAPRAVPRLGAWPRRFIWILVLLAFAGCLVSGASVVLEHTRLKDRLTAHIAATLGRPVEVGSYDFALWGGPALEAQSISVAEDPRFGQEYFLRAESVSLHLAWRSLLRGHFEIDTLSLARPSMNLVLNDAGDWNLAQWLPRPSGASVTSGGGAPYPLPRSPAVRFRRIEFDGGRINFKRGDNKLPVALVELTGAADTDTSGRWRIDLVASPWRAAVPVQQAGVLHVSGYVGGTSSRLRPAKLDISWSDASLSDVLRLARADDSGIRGTLAASINAATRDQDDAWTVYARVQLGEIHRWDLALRPDNPAANIIFQTEWHPAGSSLDLNPVVLEAPHSSARLSARISWGPSWLPPKQLVPPLYAELSGSQIDMGDLLSWVRAFRTGTAEDASLAGVATVRGVVSGWPLRVVTAVVSTDGIDVASLAPNGGRRPAHLGAVRLRYDHGLVSLPPAELSFGISGKAPDSVLRLESSSKPGRDVFHATRLSGSLSDVRDLLAATSALGWELAPGSDLVGPIRGDLRWQGSLYPWQEPPVGFVEWGGGPGGGSLRVPFLNLPVDQIRARLDLRPGARHITLTSAQAFGTHWSGTLDRSDVLNGGHEGGPQWQFSLSADRLDAADLDRWLNPRWRESFLDRMFPFLNSRPAGAGPRPENLRAAGRLNLASFNLGSLSLNHLQGDLQIDGRALDLRNAAAQLGEGAVGGSFAAHLDPAPGYEAALNFSRVDLSSITDANPALAGLFDGSASGKVSFHARGATRAELLASLDCRGSAVVARPLLRKINLVSSLGDGVLRQGASRLSGASADFSCAEQVVRLENLFLDPLDSGTDARGSSALEGAGTVDFNRDLSITLRAPGSSVQAYRLTGTLAAPEIAALPAAPLRHIR